MKAWKIAALVIGGALLLVVVLLAVALTPAVQTWAARKALADQPDMTVEIARVKAGLSRAELRDVRLVKDGAVITVARVAASYSGWGYLTGRGLHVNDLAVEDLLLDLRQADAAVSPEATQAEEPFNGILTPAQLPLDLHLARLSLRGRALLPNEQSATFTVSGGAISTGARGTLEWTADFLDETPDVPLRAVRANGTVAIGIATDRRVDALELTASAVAEGPRLPNDRLHLLAQAEQPAAGGDERYALTLSLVSATATEPLLRTRADFRAATKELAGTWDIAVRSEQLAALLAGLGLPEVAMRGSGQFAATPSTGAASASGGLDAQIARLEQVSPALAAIGGVRVRAAFDAAIADEIAQLQRLEIETTSTEGRRLALVTATQRIGFNLRDHRVTFADPNAELARIDVQNLPLAWAQPVATPYTIQRGDISLQLAVEAEPDGSRLRARAVEPLRVRNLTVSEGETKLAEELAVSAHPVIEYTDDHLHVELQNLSVSTPAGDRVSGLLAADITQLSGTPAIAFATELQAEVVTLHQPHLPFQPGSLDLRAAAEGRLEGSLLRLQKASANLVRSGGTPLVAFELQQPLQANLDSLAVTTANPTAAAARLRLGEVPLAWADSFVANAAFTGSVSGGVFDVSLLSLDELSVETVEPLTIINLAATLDGKPQLARLDTVAEFRAVKRGEVVAYDVRRFDLKQGSTSLAALVVSGEATLGDAVRVFAKGTLDADAAALLQQPALASFASVARGRIATAFEATLGDAIEAKAAGSVRNLVARENNQPLGDIELKLALTLKPDGNGTVSLPLTLVRDGRRSDLLVDARFLSSDAGFSLNGQITGNHVVVDDFQALAAVTPASPPPTAPAPAPRTPAGGPSPRSAPAPTRAPRDTEPFWKGITGKLTTDLKKVQYGQDYTIGHLRGTVTIADTRLAIDSLEGTMQENPFKVSGAVTFSAAQPQPYALTASVNVTHLDLGEILRSANPREKPAVEAKVSVVANLRGNGTNAETLARNVYGRFDVTGSQGVLRALGRRGETVGALSGVIGLIGAARGSNTTLATAELAAALNEMRFDRFTLQAERGADLNLKFTSLEFISPTTRVTGTGSIVNREGVPVDQQPMRMELKLAGKGAMAHLLNRAGLLDGKQDDKEFHTMGRTFTLSGTPINPDSGDLWRIIGEAAVRAAAEGLLK